MKITYKYISVLNIQMCKNKNIVDDNKLLYFLIIMWLSSFLHI